MLPLKKFFILFRENVFFFQRKILHKNPFSTFKEHQLTIAEIAQCYASSRINIDSPSSSKGLTTEEAETRLAVCFLCVFYLAKIILRRIY